MAAEPVAEAPPAPTAPAAAEPETKPQPPAPKGGAANKGAKPGKGAKSDKAAKAGKAAKAAASSSDGPSVAAHPRAARGVARAKSWGGLIGFVLGGYLSLPTSTLAGAGLRALIAGVVCYVAAWAAAVFVWRRMVVLELKGREQQLVEATLAAAARSEQAPVPAQRPGVRATP